MKCKKYILVFAILAVCIMVVSILVFSVILPVNEQVRVGKARLVIQQAKTDFYQQCSRCYLRNPSYSELIGFVDYDTTDKHPYINDTYVCVDFSYALIRNMTAYGFLCGYVIIRYGTLMDGHAMVAFNTTDYGLVFVEPQNDKTYNLSVGDKHTGGVIEKIIVIWWGEKEMGKTKRIIIQEEESGKIIEDYIASSDEADVILRVLKLLSK